jgi:hypothetical protein
VSARPYASRRARPARSGSKLMTFSNTAVEPTTNVVPSSAPTRLPLPPRTTITMIDIDTSNPNRPGAARPL